MRALLNAAVSCAAVLLFAPAALAAQFGFSITPIVAYTGEIDVRFTEYANPADAESSGLPYSIFLRTGPFHFAYLHYEQAAEKRYRPTSTSSTNFNSAADVTNDAFMFSYVFNFVNRRNFAVYSMLGLALVQTRWSSTTFTVDSAGNGGFNDTRNAAAKHPAVGGTAAIGTAFTHEQNTLLGVELRYFGAKTEVEGTASRFSAVTTVKQEADISGVFLSIVVGVGF